MLSVKGGGTYLTVSGPGCSDCIFEINLADGSLQRNWGDLGFSTVYGLAHWAGVAYGFSNSGSAFAIEFSGNSVVTTPIEIPPLPQA
ncbi:MAG: hypothetical protein GY811_02230 [Myxococcales bacterium]|nr:hypothetical protein [Myxococcales bacterium]